MLNPLWLVMSDGRRQGTADTFSGVLYRTTGPVFNAVPFNPGQWAIDNLATARLVHDLYLLSTFNRQAALGRDRARWTVDDKLLEAWGRRGLAAAAANLDKIVELCRSWSCRVTLIVYPWPDNVAANDRDSLQVRYWRDWSARHDVRFVDGFAPFFREPADRTLASLNVVRTTPVPPSRLRLRE